MYLYNITEKNISFYNKKNIQNKIFSKNILQNNNFFYIYLKNFDSFKFIFIYFFQIFLNNVFIYFFQIFYFYKKYSFLGYKKGLFFKKYDFNFFLKRRRKKRKFFIFNNFFSFFFLIKKSYKWRRRKKRVYIYFLRNLRKKLFFRSKFLKKKYFFSFWKFNLSYKKYSFFNSKNILYLKKKKKRNILKYYKLKKNKFKKYYSFLTKYILYKNFKNFYKKLYLKHFFFFSRLEKKKIWIRRKKNIYLIIDELKIFIE